MKAPAIVIAGAQYVDWLGQHAGGLLEPSGLRADEAETEPVALSAAAIVFVEIDGPGGSTAARLIERLCDRHPGLPVVALGASDQPAATLAAMRAGARDFLVPGRDDASVATQIERLLRRGGARSGGRGRVLAVVAGQPGTGTAFFAAHLALSALETLPPGERTLLLDLSLPAGAVSVFLNAHHEYSALNALQDAYRCDQTLVDTAFSRHGSGLYLLGLPENQVGPAAVAATDLAALLEVLHGLFSLTIVAVDGSSDAGVLRAALDAADRGLLLSEQSVLHSRYHQALLRGLRDAGCKLEHTGLVIDRFHRRHPVEPARLAALLQLPLLATLGGDPAAREQAMNAGEPLFSLAPRDEYAEAVRTLARQVASRAVIAGEGVPRRGVFGRLLSG